MSSSLSLSLFSVQVRELKLKQFKLIPHGNTVNMNSDPVRLHCPRSFLCYNRKSFQITLIYFSFTFLVMFCFWFYLIPEASWHRPPADFHKPNITVCPGG